MFTKQYSSLFRNTSYIWILSIIRVSISCRNNLIAFSVQTTENRTVSDSASSVVREFNPSRLTKEGTTNVNCSSLVSRAGSVIIDKNIFVNYFCGIIINISRCKPQMSQTISTLWCPNYGRKFSKFIRVFVREYINIVAGYGREQYCKVQEYVFGYRIARYLIIFINIILNLTTCVIINYQDVKI